MAEDLSRPWASLFTHCYSLASEQDTYQCCASLRLTMKGQRVGGGPIPGNPCPFLKIFGIILPLIQFSSVQSFSRVRLCDPMDCSTPGLPVHHQLPEFTETHVHWVRDAIKPSHPLSSPSPPALNLSQHQGLSKWVSSSHQVAKVLAFQLQHQSFQWIFRTDFL